MRAGASARGQPLLVKLRTSEARCSSREVTAIIARMTKLATTCDHEMWNQLRFAFRSLKSKSKVEAGD